MSNINIGRAVQSIKSGTNYYTPILEVLVNGIQAIKACNNNGEVNLHIIRSPQANLNPDIEAEIDGFIITDEGIGFNNENRESYDTFYSDHKINEGGKGFGRFTCLKYFNNVSIDSTYLESKNNYYDRNFILGKKRNIIENEVHKKSSKSKTGTKVTLKSIKGSGFPDRSIYNISREITEKLLPYIVDENYKCPKIIITEDNSPKKIIINNYLSKEGKGEIQEIKLDNSKFNLNSTNQEESFSVRVFKFYKPKNQKSKLSLVAHHRETTTTSIHHYIPEFINEFYETKDGEPLNYIIKAYISGNYLDEHVSLERGGFDFQKENDILYGISQNEIEKHSADIAKTIVTEDLESRINKKFERVNNYIKSKAPWHSELIKDIDITDLSYNATDEQIESKLQDEKFKQEKLIKRDVQKLLQSKDSSELETTASEILSRVTKSSKNDLAHYISLRKSVLDIFEKSISINENGKYSSENTVHNIIFPTRSNSENIIYDQHNLWLIDERLNYTEYLTSDEELNGPKSDRPDLLIYNNRISFRGDNEASNPITIFEFKKPHRDDFANPSSKDDPYKQIVRYVRQLKAGKFSTPQGRRIQITENTPFYGYIICDLNLKIEEWLTDEHDFKPMPDKQGYFKWHEKLNLYTELISWEKVLKDSVMRNKIFFKKLGIE